MSSGSIQVLHKSLQEAKKSLEGTNEAILRMSGRDPNHSRSRGTFQTDKSYEGGHMRAWSDEYLPPPKRRASGNFRKPWTQDDGQMDDGDDTIMKLGEDSTVNLKSSVSAAPVPPRPNVDSSTDKTSKQRNRRMFGMLMGTLQKFQKDSTMITEQEKRRVQIETKLEQVALKEKEEAAQQKKQLLDQRKLQRQIVGKLTTQLESAELYEEWNSHDRYLLDYIKTSAQPSIYYLPSFHNDATQSALKESNIILKDTITARHNEIKQLLQDNQTAGDEIPEETYPSEQSPQKDEQNLIGISLEKE